MSLSKTHSLLSPKTNFLLRRNNFFQWINIIFNKVDESRVKTVGPDRACAEWLLRNGAQVKWTTSAEYLGDYNKLPKEEVKLHIQEVDASDSSIMHYGFDHFLGCNHIQKIILHKCSYLEDPALAGLAHLKHTLLHLQITSCLNISEKGLKDLSPLSKLKSLLIADLPYVKDKTSIVSHLKTNLPECNIQFP